MLIQSTSITVNYEKINGLKKVYYTNEDLLRNHFNEATVLPVPDDAPEEIPRIIVRTLHEHAQLNISPTAASFEVKYNDGFERNWKSCAAYIKERMTTVFDFLNLLTNNNYKYTGIITTILYDEISDKGTEKLTHTLLNTDSIEDIHDINIKYTFTEGDNIFVNIMLENARLFKEELKGNNAGDFNSNNQLGESIGAVIDINDRCGFNNNLNYHSNSSILPLLVDSMTNVIDNKLSALIEKGEY